LWNNIVSLAHLRYISVLIYIITAHNPIFFLKLKKCVKDVEKFQLDSGDFYAQIGTTLTPLLREYIF